MLYFRLSNRLLRPNLTEDAELDLGDIPGIAPAERTSFSFVEDDVRLHLAHLPTVQIDAVVHRLRAFEGDVFETRTQPAAVGVARSVSQGIRCSLCMKVRDALATTHQATAESPWVSQG